LFPVSLDECVAEDSVVRAVAAFVEQLKIRELGFERGEAATGRPGYHPRMLLAVYIWGHLNGVRSSRRLERECGRNVELMWLSGMLKPDFKTLCRFRQKEDKAIAEVLASFRLWCDTAGLIGKEVVAIDGSKFKAVNSVDRNMTRARLEKLIAREKANAEQYLRELAETDEQEDAGEEIKLTAEELKAKIATIKEFLQTQTERVERMKEESVTQESETDPDARLMKTTKGSQVSYNVQTVVDDKNKLIVSVEVSNEAVDRGLLAKMARKAKVDLGVEELTVVADGGYYTSQAIKACEDDNITTYVPILDRHRLEEVRGRFGLSKFRYNKEKDVYICPQGAELKRSGESSEQHAEGTKKYLLYKTRECAKCPLKAKCTKSSIGRVLKRWEHEEVTERLQRRLESNPEMMRRRRGIVEHPYGTIKVSMGHERLLMKGKKNVGTEINLTVLSYNFKRVLSILGVKTVIDMFKSERMMSQMA
jgi:transposase